MSAALNGAILVSVAGGVLSLDRTAAFQVMVSRPIVTAPVIGWLLGHPEWGLVAGAALELLLIGDLPVGRYVPVHETSLAALVTGMVVAALEAMGASDGYAGLRSEMTVLPLAILMAFPASRVFQKADIITRKMNARLFETAAVSVEGGGAALIRNNLKGAAFFLVTNTVALLLTAVPLMLGASYFFTRFALRPFTAAFAGLLLAGAGAAAWSVTTDKSAYVFGVSAAAAGALLTWLAL
ncbi:MAG: PTS sugar transporter subunit IIC [Deltaproteobacteria bacterium]|nr:PTS sugar transporter subunit IIC [Deltaproteobacteria bacterium]